MKANVNSTYRLANGREIKVTRTDLSSKDYEVGYSQGIIEMIKADRIVHQRVEDPDPCHVHGHDAQLAHHRSVDTVPEFCGVCDEGTSVRQVAGTGPTNGQLLNNE